MRNFVIALLALACSSFAHATPRGFDVDDLVRLDRVADPRLSPDGTQVAFSLRETDYAANKGLQSVWRVALDGAARPQRLTAVGQNAASPRWSANGRALYFLSPRSGSMQLWRLALDGGEAMQVSDYPLDIGTYQLSPDGRRVAVTFEVFLDCNTLACSKARIDAKAARKDSGQVFDRLHMRHWDSWSSGRKSQLFVAELDAEGRAGAMPSWISRGIDGDVLSRPSPDASEYAWSPDGRAIAFSANVQGRERAWNSNSDLYLAAIDGSSAPRNLSAANPASDSQPLFAPDGRTLYYLATARPQIETDRPQIMALDLASGTARKIAADWDRSAGALQVSRDGRTLYTLADADGERPLFAIDVKTGVARDLSGAGNVIGASVGANAIVIARDTLTSPAQLFALDAKRGQLRALTDFNAERLAGIAMGTPEFFEFQGWKNERVEGYVVKPWNYQAGRKYPVAFLVHGGPHSPFGNAWHYRWNPQTYAGLGYAVVSINFHGSGGYGQAFTDSIVGEWGDGPLEDLQKGLAAAVARYDWLDRDRACALGASYGGYMMNWILGRWPDGFDCLVSHGGVFDTRFFAYSIDSVGFMERQMVGTPFANPQQFERHNPVNHVAHWKTPTLVIHGALDYRVPLEEGIAMFTALQRRGIESKFLMFPDENHWVLKPHNSVQWHREVEAWLRAHLQ